jgi:hypothetical protein
MSKTKVTANKFLEVAIFLLALSIPLFCMAQHPSANSSDIPEMIPTSQGFVAIQTPNGWERVKGPGLAFFLRKGDKEETANVWIYISSAPVGPSEEDKDANAYIQSDIEGFKKRFKKGSVQQDESIELPYIKIRVPVYTFKSSEDHNAFEQIVYVPESGRVLILALSSKNHDSFAKSVEEFRDFAKSYRGSIITEPATK